MSYTKSLTTDQPDKDFLAAELKRGKTYKLRLKSEIEFIVNVSKINQDSLYGTFYFMQGSRKTKMKSSVSLRDIADVKAGKINVVPTIFLIGVPVGLIIFAIHNISFNLGPGFTL